jgi:hypothetical protein
MDAGAQKAIAALKAENAKLRSDLAELKTAVDNFTIEGLAGAGPGGMSIPDDILQTARGGGTPGPPGADSTVPGPEGPKPTAGVITCNEDGTITIEFTEWE